MRNTGSSTALCVCGLCVCVCCTLRAPNYLPFREFVCACKRLQSKSLVSHTHRAHTVMISNCSSLASDDKCAKISSLPRFSHTRKSNGSKNVIFITKHRFPSLIFSGQLSPSSEYFCSKNLHDNCVCVCSCAGRRIMQEKMSKNLFQNEHGGGGGKRDPSRAEPNQKKNTRLIYITKDCRQNGKIIKIDW